MFLSVQNLTCGYAKVPVLKNITFQLEKGKVLGVVGPNGSGKTTLIRAITRTLKPFFGKIIFEGRDIYQMGFKEFARKVAVVSQNLPAGEFTLEEFVLLGRIPHFGRLQFLERESDLASAKKAILLTGISELQSRRLEEMSGGEKQLASIARALCQEPSLLILDEPTAHLDIAHQVIVLNLLRKLNRELSLTVLMVIHDLNLASQYCDQIILLSKGEIKKFGLPEEVLTYQTIEEVYQTAVVVAPSPVSGKPYVFVVPFHPPLH